MGNKLTDREIRALLKAEAENDPDGWAALATRAREAAAQELSEHKPASPYLNRAIRDLTAAEKLERDVLTRYVEPKRKNTNGNTETEPQDLADTEAKLREQLRTEHQDPKPAETAPHTEAQPRTKQTTGVL